MGSNTSRCYESPVDDYPIQVKGRPESNRRYVVVYDAIRISRPLYDWCHRNRPSNLPSSKVSSVIVHTEFYQTLQIALNKNNLRTHVQPISIPLSKGNQVKIQPGYWEFTLRDCCVSVDSVFRNIAFALVDGELRSLLQMKVSSNMPSNGGWYIFRLFMCDWENLELALCAEQVVRKHGVRSILTYYKEGDPNPRYLSHVDNMKLTFIIDKVPVHGNNSFERLHQHQYDPTYERKRCRECMKHIPATDLLDSTQAHQKLSCALRTI